MGINEMGWGGSGKPRAAVCAMAATFALREGVPSRAGWEDAAT